MTEYCHRLPGEVVEVSLFKDIQKLSRPGPRQLALGGSAWASLGQMTCRGPFQLQPLCNSVITSTFTQDLVKMGACGLWVFSFAVKVC